MGESRRVLVWAALVAIAIAAGWLAFGTDAAPERAAPADATTRDADPVPPTAPAPDEPEEPAGRVPDAGRADAPTTRSSSLLVRVVDENDEPLADAEVGHFVELDSDDPKAFVVGAERERRAWAGGLARTGATGETRLAGPANVTSWTVYGRHGPRWGSLFVRAKSADEAHVLKLEPDVTVRVRTVDARDEPLAAVPIGLARRADLPRRGGLRRPTTAPDGIAEFTHVQTYFRDVTDAVVFVATPLEPPVATPIDLAELPTEPILLRMPAPTGAITVRLVGAANEPLQGLTDSVYGQLYHRTTAGEVPHWLPFDDDGALHVAQVGLGLQFRLELSAAEVSGRLEFAGPTFAGEHVEKTLAVARHPTLSGRLVDEAGAPQQGYWFATHIHAGSGWYNQYFETEVDGRFHCAVPQLDNEIEGTRRVWFRRTLPDVEHHAAFELADLVRHGGRNEVGDVVLRAPPLLVAGRVVDDANEPIAGASVKIYRGDPENDVWQIAGSRDDTATSAADGSFRVLAHHAGRPGEPLLALAILDRRRSSFVRFTEGQVGVECVLPRVGTIELPLSFADGLQPSDVLFGITDHATGKTRRVVSQYVLEGEIVRWKALRPGRYDVSVDLLGGSTPLLSFADVDVVGEETTTLDRATVGANLTSLRVRVVGPDERPVDDARIVVDPDDGTERPRVAQKTALGELVLRTATTPVDLLVFAPGYRSTRVHAVAADHTVRLERGYPVELRVTLPDDFLKPGQKLVPLPRRYDAANPDPQPWDSGHDLWLRGAGSIYYASRHAWLWNQSRPLDASGRVDFAVPAPGDYAVEWEVRGDSFRELSDRARRTFTVSASAAAATEPTVVELTLGADDVR